MLLRGQAEFPRIISQMAKMTLKVKVNDLHFQYRLRFLQDAYLDACLVILAQICDE